MMILRLCDVKTNEYDHRTITYSFICAHQDPESIQITPPDSAYKYEAGYYLTPYVFVFP